MTALADAAELEVKAKDGYRLVAQDPRDPFHLEPGEPPARRLGYDPRPTSSSPTRPAVLASATA